VLALPALQGPFHFGALDAALLPLPAAAAALTVLWAKAVRRWYSDAAA